MSEARTYRLPTRFWYDHHVSRECSPSAVVVRETKSYVLVELDDEAYRDLHSDCVYYATLGEGDAWLRGISSSARATLRALDV